MMRPGKSYKTPPVSLLFDVEFLLSSFHPKARISDWPIIFNTSIVCQ